MRWQSLLGTSVIIAGCAGSAPEITGAPSTPPSTVEHISLADVGIEASRLDRSVDPCQDFYQFSCGGWMAKTEIPSDQSRWGTFDEIFQRNEELLHELLEQARTKPSEDPVLAKLGAYYGACMDEAAVEAADLTALQPLIKTIRSVKDSRSLVAVIAELHKYGVNAVFGIGPVQDKKDATQVTAQLLQGGLGLPDREYYLSSDEKMQTLRMAYVAHVEKLLTLGGRKPADAKRAAADVLAIETELAKSHKTPVELRDELGTYNRLDRAGIAKAAPGVQWDLYFQTLGFPTIHRINVPAPKAIEALGHVLPKFKPAQWQAYLETQLLIGVAGLLPKRFVDEAFAFHKILTGQKEPRPRWKRCITYTDADLGELLGQPYVARAFAGDSKSAAETTIGAIRTVFDAALPSISWMDDATREKTRAKLAKIEFLIGYPENPRRYDFPVDAKNAAQNDLVATRAEVMRQLARVDQPLDRHLWQITPPTVNAYYDQSLNQMVFPAGILQRPFYDVHASAAVNLGAIGMIVGHELTHGFDDQGAQYDGDGNLSGWWPEAVAKGFGNATQCVANYYSQYEPLPGLKLNGELTLGENIADIGGTKLAFQAYRSLRKGQTPKIAEGFTEDQQFFIAFGQAWCEKNSDEMTRILVGTDPHSPSRFRVLGTLSNVPDFSEAFHCPLGSPMHPKESCQVW